MALESVLPAAGAWLWSNYGKNVAGKVFSVGRKKWDETKWKTAADAYRGKVIKLYDSMQIMGMVEPLPLEDIFTDVYLLDKPTAFYRFNIEHLQKVLDGVKTLNPSRRLNGLQLVSQKVKRRRDPKLKSKAVVVEADRNFFILGKPGAGKTTFLKYIAVQAAKQRIDKVPIFISLKEWSDSNLELLPFITQRFEICNFPNARPFVEELLKSGNVIVLFDGLDEVNQEGGQRDTQTGLMKEFVEQYDCVQCLITCRVAASDYTFEPFTYVEIADFTEDQIRTFVSNWFRNKEGEKDEETCNRFLLEFEREDNKGLRDLARTPLLLTLLCLAFDETLTFPQRRIEIYSEALDALLKKWDSSRRIKRDEVYRKLSLGHKENMLGRIAAETFERNQYFIPRFELETLITTYVRSVPPHDANELADGAVILKSIEAQHGIFVERARGIYSFSHLTFQEYFTSQFLVANATTNDFSKFVRHCVDARWREVFLLTASLLPEARAFIWLFRKYVDELLIDEAKLISLLNDIYGTAKAIQSDSGYLRAYYLYSKVYYHSQTPSLDRALERALVRALNSSRDDSVARALDVDVSMSLTRTAKRLGRVSRTIRRRESRFKGAFDHARRQDAMLRDLKKQLETLTLPTSNDDKLQWHTYGETLRHLIVTSSEGHADWKLSENQESLLETYLDAIYLLQDCLELAFMPPDEKEAVLKSLFLPPPQESTPEISK